MASPAILDFAKLTTPIAGANPCGVALRTDPARPATYDATKDGRNKARADEKKLYEGGEDALPPDWKVVVQAGVKSLTEKSKDLEISAYMIEGLARIHGFAGLRDGFRLARELVEKFWDTLYPMPDEDGIESRIFALVGLNGGDAEGTLIVPINRIAIT